MIGKQVGHCHSKANRGFGPPNTQGPVWVQEASQWLPLLGRDSQDSEGLPTLASRQPWGPWQEAPSWLPGQLPLWLTFPIKAQDRNIGVWGPRTGLHLLIQGFFLPSFLVNISTFHELIKLLFPETGKRAFGPGWAQSISSGPEITSCSCTWGAEGCSRSEREGCRWPGRTGHAQCRRILALAHVSTTLRL